MRSQISLRRYALQGREPQHPALIPPQQPKHDAMTQPTLAVEKQHGPGEIEIIVGDHRKATVLSVGKSHRKGSLHHKPTRKTSDQNYWTPPFTGLQRTRDSLPPFF